MNGQSVMASHGMATELAFLSSLNLRKASGDGFDPATYTSFRNWLLNATATNVAYMLSASYWYTGFRPWQTSEVVAGPWTPEGSFA